MLNRGERRNALTREMLEELAAALDRVAADGNVRALVLSAAGPVFCAGMDLRQMQDRATAPDAEEEWRRDSRIYAEVLEALCAFPVPTIAAVQGGVLAGGMGLILACDFVIAVEEAFFGLPEPARGITAAMVTPLLVHRIGAGSAGRWLLSGERYSAAEGRTAGLCHAVVSADDLEDRVRALCGSIQQGSASALRLTKSHLLGLSIPDLHARLEHSLRVSADARATDDAREGLRAFLEKRNPRWQA